MGAIEAVVEKVPSRPNAPARSWPLSSASKEQHRSGPPRVLVVVHCDSAVRRRRRVAWARSGTAFASELRRHRATRSDGYEKACTNDVRVSFLRRQSDGPRSISATLVADGPYQSVVRRGVGVPRCSHPCCVHRRGSRACGVRGSVVGRADGNRRGRAGLLVRPLVAAWMALASVFVGDELPVRADDQWSSFERDFRRGAERRWAERSRPWRIS